MKVAEDIVIQRAAGGSLRVLNREWPDEVDWSQELLETPSTWLQNDGLYVTLRVTNGLAVYVILEGRPGTGIVEPVHRVIRTRLVEGFIR